MAKDEEKTDEEKPDPPRTEQEFKAALNKLTKDAESAGVNTVKAMLLVGLAGAVQFVNSVTASLEGEPEKAKPKRKKKPSA